MASLPTSDNHNRPTPDPRTVVDLVKELAESSSTLLAREGELLRAELSSKANELRNAAIAVGGGLVVVFSGVLILLLGAVYGLAETLPLWASALIIGGIATVAGLLMLRQGAKNATSPDLTPDKTVDTTKAVVQQIKEQLS